MANEIRKLFYAAGHGDLELCRKLISQGANVNEKYCGSTALHEAAKSGSAELCQYLIEQGADVNAKTFSNETALHEAARSGHVELCRYLIAHGFDVNAMSSFFTPLHLAAVNGNLELCQCLIEAGANVNAVCNNGRTALGLASTGESVELCQYLVSRGATVKGMPIDPDWMLDEVSDYLLSQGAVIVQEDVIPVDPSDAEETDDNGEYVNPGMLAAIEADAVRRAERQKAENHDTLYQAARKGSTERCKELIEQGTDVNAKYDNGRTALHAVAETTDPFSEEDNVEFCEYLISRGADAGIKDDDGKTALYYAAENDSVKLCECLLSSASAEGMEIEFYWQDDVKKCLLSHGAKETK